ncbi:MAG: nitroreductase [Deferrisomatales bacterium]|nr:nitroreductase [Deferrisomatales bacterium]
MELLDAMEERKSCRAFRPEAPNHETLVAVLQSAARAPSAVNLQPWRVWVGQGEELTRLKRALHRAYREQNIGCSPGGGRKAPPEADGGPGSFRDLGRVVEARGDAFGAFINEGSCNLYGAPVGIFCFTEPGEPVARRLDCGIWLAYLLLGAHARGLATCPVGLLADYQDVVKDALFVPENHEFACAVALGYARADDPVNSFACPRKGIDGVEWV